MNSRARHASGIRQFFWVCLVSNLAVGLLWFIYDDNERLCGASGTVFGLFGFALLIGFLKITGLPSMPCP